jgi:hypothetical protein
MQPSGFGNILLGAAALLGAHTASSSHALAEGRPATFSVLIESVSNADTLVLPDGTVTRAPISPGLYLVSPKKWAVFHTGDVASGTPLERLAEDGNPNPLVEALNAQGNRATRFLHDEAFTITAEPGDRLHFAVMFAQSNDAFLAPRASGIELFDREGRPFSGDATSAVVLWDAGTEVNQPPGAGPDQAPRQAAPDTGDDENSVLRVLADGFRYPEVGEVIRVTIRLNAPVQDSRR